MAIKKKGNTGFLNGTTVEKLDNIVQAQSEAPAANSTTEATPIAPEVTETPEKPQENAPVEAQSSPEAAPEARKPLTLEDVMASEDLIKQVAQQIIKQGGAKGIEFEHPKQARVLTRYLSIYNCLKLWSKRCVRKQRRRRELSRNLLATQ